MVGRSIALALLALILSLRTLAFASPPDQTWLGGFWDDADYDDVVLLATSTPGSPATVITGAVEPHWALIWIFSASDDGAMPAPPRPCHCPRGPPLSDPRCSC